MSLRLLALVALLLAVTALSSAPLPFPRDRGKGDLKAMQGEWVATTYTAWAMTPGRTVRVDIQSVTVRVEGDRLLFSQFGTRNAQKAVRLDASKRPGWIDTDHVGADLRRGGDQWPWAGIYKLEGDTLTICEAPGRRPADFSGGNDGERLLILKRVKPRP